MSKTSVGIFYAEWPYNSSSKSRRHWEWNGCCISCLLLHNKLPPHFSCFKLQTYYLTHRRVMNLGDIYLAHDFTSETLEFVVKTYSPPEVMTQGFRPFSSQFSSCWKVSTLPTPHQAALERNLVLPRVNAGGRKGRQRKRKEEGKGREEQFYSLIRVLAYYAFSSLFHCYVDLAWCYRGDPMMSVLCGRL